MSAAVGIHKGSVYPGPVPLMGSTCMGLSEFTMRADFQARNLKRGRHVWGCRNPQWELISRPGIKNGVDMSKAGGNQNGSIFQGSEGNRAST